MTASASMIGEALAGHVRDLQRSMANSQLAAVRHAKSDTAFRLAWAKQYAVAEGTVKQRESKADMETISEREEAKEAEVLYRVARDSENSQRTILSAFQTWSGVVKEEMKLTQTARYET